MLIAHQGGWDEILMVLVPIAAVVLLLRLANRRARAAGVPTAPRPPGGAPEPDPGRADTGQLTPDN